MLATTPGLAPRRADAFPLARPVPPLRQDVLAPLSAPGSIVETERDTEIVAQGARAEYCLQIVAGCVRTCQILEDGRRQVGEFLFAGDVFGWETSGVYAFAAEAVTAVRLRRLRLSAVEERANADLTFARHLRHYCAAQINATRGRLVILGRKTARERVACFLLDMESRLAAPGCTAIELPMNRADIADYLGLTTETVCRALTELRQQKIISVDRSRITCLDHGGLARIGFGHLQ